MAICYPIFFGIVTFPYFNPRCSFVCFIFVFTLCETKAALVNYQTVKPVIIREIEAVSMLY